MKNLWGDRFFDPATKKWANSQAGNAKRGFNQFVLDPIFQVFDAIMNIKKDKTAQLVEKLGIKLGPDEKDLEGKALMKVCCDMFELYDILRSSCASGYLPETPCFR